MNDEVVKTEINIIFISCYFTKCRGGGESRDFNVRESSEKNHNRAFSKDVKLLITFH